MLKLYKKIGDAQPMSQTPTVKSFSVFANLETQS